SEREKDHLKATVRKINAAYDQYVAFGSPDRLKPKNLRIRDVEDATGVWEVTWSFSGPDGRATFEVFEAEDKQGIRWRRIGGHEIFSKP
ncbi:MAG TPA: hypothetical protein VNF68_03395, partial [Candidatus Baltobacteraceae bacterium]|nr:hypothetical protein [Candidatus Baltobacteraceae bacterium]